MSNPTTVRLAPIPPSRLRAVRAAGHDLSGHPLEPLADPVGAPLRCCLRNAGAGEQVVLFGYEPPLPGVGGPYREIGAVLAHAHDCGGPAAGDGYPPDWLGRPQVLRAYDERGWIHPASTCHDGADPAAALAAVLAQPGVVQVHSRNVVYGCFMFVAVACA